MESSWVILTKLAENHIFWEDETCNQRVTAVFLEQPHLHTAGCITGKMFDIFHLLDFLVHGTMVLVIQYIGLKYTGMCFESVNISIVVITLINVLMFYAFVLSITHV